MARQGVLKLGEKVVIPECRIADDFFSRFLGLMGKTNVPEGTGVLFPKCNSIHMFFMRMPIDVVFIAGNGDVVEVVPGLRPWKLLLPRSKAKHTLELGVGKAASMGIRLGVKLSCEGIF